ncbi:hypothetical protein K4L06_10415 [Lysobacter sp. BMK333-48F3]|uniref:hypothetical protein n=1 Tax=Lysobacter sp. BMK333-48F3 TaxID=2867962 RepID=UPI001C8BCF28|nr:hypothetical protein [Lysobacter sp. BMK333-48F3]MBX9401725.1 hypothetical protein [Lysobacter sp. BMK333-48F3]
MAGSHVLDGAPADWLRDQDNLFVRFGLNVEDADARRRNRGAQALMFTDARLPQAAPGRVFPNLVAVSRGAALSIQVRSPSPLGFGFRIATDAGPVVDRLYAVDRPDEWDHRTATVRRFQHDRRLIVVESMRARLGDARDRDALQRLWRCEISTWKVRQFLDPVSGRVYDENHPRFASPLPTAAPDIDTAPAAAGRIDTRRGHALEAATEGQVRVNPGVIWADGNAEQRFERIQVQAEDDPEHQRIGALQVHFFVVDPD